MNQPQDDRCLKQSINFCRKVTKMKQILIAIVTCTALAAASGCAIKPETAMRLDSRAGTSLSPYRTIAPAIQCDDCRYLTKK